MKIDRLSQIDIGDFESEVFSASPQRWEIL